MTLPEGWTTSALLDAAMDEQVVFVRGAPFYASGKGSRELRFAFSFESPERLTEGRSGWG